jgi:DNA-binding HxlR family transcriptional regulator
MVMNKMTESLNSNFDRSPCPVANMLDLFGDKWTLLIIRDLILGKIRYGEFAKSAESIPTNILANRLKRLEVAGIIVKTAYCDKPVRYQYELTDKGKELQPVLEAMVDWANKHIPGTRVFPRYR